jgi:IclR family transcriptional regulator, acetate operon repressor
MYVGNRAASPVASVDRALRIMEVVGGSSGGISLDQLAGQLGIPKSSLHRILAALKYRRFVTQPEPGGSYFLGSELLATAFRFYDMLDLPTLIHPLLARLADELGETVHLAVLAGGHVVYQDLIYSPRSIRSHEVIGERDLAHATAAGKALLAWTYPTDEAVRSWAAQTQAVQSAAVQSWAGQSWAGQSWAGQPQAGSRQLLPMVTERTISSVPALAGHLALVRATGYACDLEENEVAVQCVAAPVFLGRLIPAAAVGVSLIAASADPGRLAEIGEFLVAGTRHWSATSRP